jgi:tRNA(Ile)-lysidine synthase
MSFSATYIIAVSGGVDSVVLLHKLMLVKPPHITYVVAHFDHGMRDDSKLDKKFVEKIANAYKLEVITGSAKLGRNASEDEARNARYEFLRKIMKDNKAKAIITGHHQDDVLETMIVNILRGTSPRGLIGFTQPNILRPLINKTKLEIIKYAINNGLKWREDKTNKDLKYIRNYVRLKIIPKLKDNKNQLLTIRENVIENYREIDDLTKKLLIQIMKKNEIVRQRFVNLPYKVQCELIATLLRINGVEIDLKTIKRVVLAVKTLQPKKHIEINKNFKLFSNKTSVELKS